MALQFGISWKGGKPEYVRVRRWPFRIGRSPKCDLCLANSNRISRQHVRVVKTGGSYFLIPRGKNATFLNGELVARDSVREIKNGDTIELPASIATIESSVYTGAGVSGIRHQSTGGRRVR